MAKRKPVQVSRSSDPSFRFNPKTDNQERAADYYDDGFHLVLHGSAGTGKTYLALNKALESLRNGEQKKVVIIRSAVPVRDIGFLPGTVEEKLAAYEQIYMPMVNEMAGRGDYYGILKKTDRLEFISTSFLRGATLRDSVVIVDEFENLSPSEINTVVTRIGTGSRLILCGDLVQSDLGKQKSGFQFLTNVAKHMREFRFVGFTHDDIVRSGFVKSWIINAEKYSDFYK